MFASRSEVFVASSIPFLRCQFNSFLATKIQYITRKSCTNNTLIVPFPNLAAMLLSVLIAKSNRGITNIAWMNIDTYCTESFICFIHESLVSYRKIEGIPCWNQKVFSFVRRTPKNGVLPRCTNEYFLTVGVTFKKEVLSLFKSTVCTKKVLYVLLAIRYTAPVDSNYFDVIQIQMIRLCKWLSGVSVLRVL